METWPEYYEMHLELMLKQSNPALTRWFVLRWLLLSAPQVQ